MKLLVKAFRQPGQILDKSNLLPSMQTDYITKIDYRRILKNELNKK